MSNSARQSTTRNRLRLFSAALLLPLTLVRSWTQPAFAHDPTLAHTIVTPTRGNAGTVEGDTGRSAFTLPRHPQLDWRTRLGAPVLELGAGPRAATPNASHPPNVLLVSTSDGRLVELDARGLERWAEALPATAVAPPIITRSAQRLVLTQDAQLLSFSGNGDQHFAQTLPLRVNDSSGKVVELLDGTLLVAWGRDLVLLDPDGGLRSALELDAEFETVFVDGRTLVLRTSDGQVSTWDGYFRPRRIARVQAASNVQWLGKETGLVVASDGALACRAPVERQARWLELDAGKFWGSLALLPEPGRVVARGTPDLLVSANSTGELKRWVLSQSNPAKHLWPEVLVDDRGTMIAMTNDGQLAAISDVVRRLTLRGCPTVAKLVSLGPGKLAASCGDGVIIGVADEPSPPK